MHRTFCCNSFFFQFLFHFGCFCFCPIFHSKIQNNIASYAFVLFCSLLRSIVRLPSHFSAEKCILHIARIESIYMPVCLFACTYKCVCFSMLLNRMNNVRFCDMPYSISMYATKYACMSCVCTRCVCKLDQAVQYQTHPHASFVLCSLVSLRSISHSDGQFLESVPFSCSLFLPAYTLMELHSLCVCAFNKFVL